MHDWLNLGSSDGLNHFQMPLHAKKYMPEVQKIFPNYSKGGLPADFVSWNSLKNLKSNLPHIPTSNPHGLNTQNFASFVISEIEEAYPGKL